MILSNNKIIEVFNLSKSILPLIRLKLQKILNELEE